MKSSHTQPRMPDADRGDVHALAKARLRAASVRVTSARVNVLAALMDARRAFSHQDVQETFQEMDRVTLYRALDCLINAGLAHKIAGDDRVFRYSAGTEWLDAGNAGASTAQDVASAQHQHIHFKCTRCAKVFCLDNVVPAGPLTDMLSVLGPERRLTTIREMQDVLQQKFGSGFLSHDIELTVKGWCADCATSSLANTYTTG